MSKVSISEAIRMAQVSRSHFYKKYINPGLISVIIEDDKKQIDISELIRVFGNIVLKDNEKEQASTPQDISNIPEKDRIIQLLEQQLAESRTREDEAKARENWLKTQIDDLKTQQTLLLENKIKPKRKKFLGVF